MFFDGVKEDMLLLFNLVVTSQFRFFYYSNMNKLMCVHIKAHGTLEWYIKVGETSGVAEGFEVESQLLHTCACLIIMLDILCSFH